jgi:hypothetical protein
MRSRTAQMRRCGQGRVTRWVIPSPCAVRCRSIPGRQLRSARRVRLLVASGGGSGMAGSVRRKWGAGPDVVPLREGYTEGHTEAVGGDVW